MPKRIHPATKSSLNNRRVKVQMRLTALIVRTIISRVPYQSPTCKRLTACNNNSVHLRYQRQTCFSLEVLPGLMTAPLAHLLAATLATIHRQYAQTPANCSPHFTGPTHKESRTRLNRGMLKRGSCMHPSSSPGTQVESRRTFSSARQLGTACW